MYKISDLKKRIIDKKQYSEKWIKPFEDLKIKIDEYPKAAIKSEIITDRDKKHEITYKILSPAPSYFANEFTFKHYIEMVSDTDYRVFKYCGHEIAFIATRPVFDNILEIYMMGICEGAQSKSLSDKIMAQIKNFHAKEIGRDFITVKVPAKSAVHNKTSKLYDFYLSYGFTHIESLESPWDEKKALYAPCKELNLFLLISDSRAKKRMLFENSVFSWYNSLKKFIRGF